ncbi:MAG: Adenylate cyclase [candidate division CPR2 bacterium GW2011_GWC1_41_48]|uniref:Adenylate cyclase n=1 Tax=candidate division CPR2 bacterium GW2011_GWC1_41_48 TaxID=1618344 RepID=A0A0G0WBL6_UNCC2|nr:MAG: Adenylate cyclase [candidate division CPR2 bacterium GW2011_GWC2_39_35]KKR28975.1 MAG: Adenylate cyclase [candidate division CPR2 bacterium GW2011_GWD2_39_7]KKR29251.1 MAG: Adenylate cyclase [candidate division CPR2 bacterium GW2011_GWD1_39_7]KKS09472.1 MAG: Adenylate cyclase [candidate division CPR2 bacterium GW2011_GWC1_41_48]OGB62181.1 MAG: hypothetical protein A2Y27_00735 [candidate division CPR2 bacterium GWD1_39_7]OGB70376.1 MAG: hypothetical protein A2Y26_00165 [candidate divisi
MKKDIEVEIRGPIEKEKIDQLEDLFKKEGHFKKTKERILIDYSTFLPEEGIENRQKDIRLRVTNGIPEVIVKLGGWGGSENRKEISVPTNKGEFDKLVQIFGAIGLKKGVLCIRKSQIYDYKEIEFALVEVPGHSYFYEAEKILNSDEDSDKAKKEIKTVCKELDLKIFTDKDYFSYIEKLNDEANEIFDFDEYKDNYFKKRFEL